MRVLLYPPALLATALPASLALAVTFSFVAGIGLVPGRIAGLPTGALIGYAGQTIAIVATTWAFCRWLDRRSLASLGLQRSPGWTRQLLGGFVISGVLMSAIFWLLVASGLWRIIPRMEPILLDLRIWTPLALVGFGLVAFNEELVARGYLLQNLEQGIGRSLAVLLSSLVFALGHLGNPGIGLLPLLGLLCAGVVLALLYYWRRSLWLPIGYHLGWNFFQGPIFGFPVSGLKVPGIFTVESVGADVLSGGAFGPEASVMAIGLEILVLSALASSARGRES